MNISKYSGSGQTLHGGHGRAMTRALRLVAVGMRAAPKISPRQECFIARIISRFLRLNTSWLVTRFATAYLIDERASSSRKGIYD